MNVISFPNQSPKTQELQKCLLRAIRPRLETGTRGCLPKAQLQHLPVGDGGLRHALLGMSVVGSLEGVGKSLEMKLATCGC